MGNFQLRQKPNANLHHARHTHLCDTIQKTYPAIII